ncbi:RNA polymerase sigma factor [Listeria seeligeri]|uniref:RNA polymerase sigma factor n=1 Tax=Listeria seeligeri TaxID=1640 RepID=UPI0022EA93BE|nr:RNA polymerase sigma factor [Listeria seeligeri]
MLLSNEQIIQITKQMYVYLLRQGVRAEVAKDLAQDAIIKAWCYEKEIPPEKQKAFIFKIVTNEFYQYYRKHQREVITDNFSHFTHADELAEDLLIQHEENAKITITLKQLNKNHQKLLIMKYDIGMSYQEIADYLDTTPTNVKTYLSRARSAFKKIWGDFNEQRTK